MTLTKADIKDSICNTTDLKRIEASSVIETLLEIIESTLESGEDILISGFGKFCVKKKKQRRGRNPHTADELTLGARRVVTFKCAGVLKHKLNEKG
jgi:integration host factor subunit alpha